MSGYALPGIHTRPPRLALPPAIVEWRPWWLKPKVETLEDEIAVQAITVQGGAPTVNWSSGARTSITQAVTISAGAGNRLLLVFSSHEDSTGAVSGMTWNGTALTKFDSSNATTWTRTEGWYLKAPATGTFNVVANKASFGNNHWGIAIYVLEGVDQTTTFRTVGKGSADTGTSSSHTVAAWAAGDLLLDILSVDATGHTPTVGANQTADFATQNYGAGSNETRGSSQTTTDGVMSWTWTTSAPNSHLAVGIIPASSGTTVALGQASETDTANATAWAPKNRLVGQASEIDTSQTMTRRKTRALGQVPETDTATTFGRLKTLLLGRTPETDTAQTLSHGQQIPLNQASELDSARAITVQLRRLVDRALETDTAQALALVTAGVLAGPAATSLAYQLSQPGGSGGL